ncbi:MAG: hypothetical protein H6830_12295 [Planctomycetes bacterium]|nr:hypothetical protein [Planctomycetota bacterium]MCB9910859.1 hypothetical protein [Planctomycetota bacterium]MCB9912209.1 hypothetical protein [Planctomycetota bacterium]HPF14003.1 hypothetical protein [Planctomycetota bacterium]HRV80989.1 hypothetical protein [Planctomycetota bacterium]
MQDGQSTPSAKANPALPGAYGTRAYAQCLEHLGQPVELPASGGWVLERAWDGCVDATGPYPLLCPSDPSRLERDFEDLASKWLSVAAVIDPMIELAPDVLQRAFPDRWVAYKEHFVVDLSKPLETTLSGHHQRKAKRGERRVRIEWNEGGEAWGDDWDDGWDDDWVALYQALSAHHQISGPAAFSAASLVGQLRLPRTLVQRALIDDDVVSMVVWYPRGEGVSYHLGASLPAGYAASASYALFADALRRFQAQGLAWAHLGAGAGVQAGSAGLTAFKAGWASHSRTAYFGGRVGQRERYQALCASAGLDPNGPFFPAYRAPRPSNP